MWEVELKSPVADLAAVERRLRALHASKIGEHTEVDRYFNAPDRDFAKTDEALRIRIAQGKAALTYKGPKIDAASKTREELEVGLRGGAVGGDRAATILERLGYRPVLEVRKDRRIYRLQCSGYEIDISLDDVAGLGRFVELEIRVGEKEVEQARRALNSLAAELGLFSSERRSYLELLLEKGEGEDEDHAGDDR